METVSFMLDHREGFYYLMHPADFIGPGDLDAPYHHTLDRMGIPLKEKLQRAEEIFELMAGSGRPVLALESLVKGFG
jgi:hypothetical protein